MSELILEKGGTITRKWWDGDKQKHMFEAVDPEKVNILACLYFSTTLEKGFTLRDYFKVVERYKGLQLLDNFFQAYLREYRKAPESGCKGGLKALILTQIVNKEIFPKHKDCEVHISFDGEGIDPETKELTTYAIDFSPLDKLLDLPIILRDLHYYFNDFTKKGGSFEKETYPTSYNLWEVINGVIWELSFHGIPEERDERSEDLLKRVEEVKNGTAELVPFDEVKKKIKAKAKKKKSKK